MTSVTDRGITESYAYDSYGRITQKVTKNGSATLLTETYTYKTNSSGKPTGQIATHKSVSAGRTVTYTYNYDANGNITSVSDGTYTTTYAYDSANQLIRENNREANKTWTFSYDNASNLTAWKEYAYTTGSLGSATATKSYTYGNTSWDDLLTAWNGNTITSDAIGNMLSDGTRTYTWRNGRELATVTMGGSTWTNTYDADGMRTKRTNGTTTYSYIYNGSQLSQLVISTATTADGTTTTATQTLNFAYDASGNPMAVVYNGTTYYYATNLQGDVVAILNSNGAAVVSYTYDAWGNILTTTGTLADTLGQANPLRYRGYVYDHETGLYYVSSRYYDPEIGRFINADALVSTGQGVLGNNMFTYCVNNPVNMIDPTGQCSYFLFFKKDCFTATCPDSQCYNPDAPNVVVIYDGRFSGTIFRESDHGFEHQASELCRRLVATSSVTSYAYTTVDDFVGIWNGLDGSYDAIYIVGHGYEGELRFKGGRSIAAQNGTYSFSDLDHVSVDRIYLYACHGATIYGENGSIAMHLSSITGASVRAVKDGKLNFTWYGCLPIPVRGGYWVTVS